MRVKGQYTISKGRVPIRVGHNLIVTAGLNLLATIVNATGTARPGWMAMGSDDTAPLSTQTALQGTEFQRVALVRTASNAKLIMTATLGNTASSIVPIEFGLFDAATAGTMLARFTSDSFTLATGDTVLVSWELEFED